MRNPIKGYWGRCRRAVEIKGGVWGTSASLLLAGGAALVVPGTEIIGIISIAVGALLFLWGLHINGRHLWQPWWQGRPSPFVIGGGVDRFDYERGATVAGIPWEQGFSHVWLRITNESPNTLENVDALFAPEYPIIDSRARSAFTDCRIGPLHGRPQITLLIETPDGRRVAKAQEPDHPGNYAIDPAHRLRCDTFPSGVTVDVDLATVAPHQEPTASGIWNRERTDPTSVRVRITWAEAGCTYGAEQMVELKGVDHDRRS